MVSLQGHVMRLKGGVLNLEHTQFQTRFDKCLPVRQDLAKCLEVETLVLEVPEQQYEFYFQLRRELLFCIVVKIKENRLSSEVICWKDYYPYYFHDSEKLVSQTEKLQKKAFKAVCELPSYRLLVVTGEMKI